jgi:hypothetical protein
MDMKMKNILKYFGLLTVVLLLTSCEDYLDVNTDPNNPTSVSPDLVLPVGHKYTGQLMQQDRRISHLGNMFMYNWSQSDGFSWYTDEFKYNVTSSFYRNIFRLSYSQALKQYQILSQLEGPENENYRAIGIVMKAFHFQLLVDMYGDVPYTEALLRKDNATPVYDDAQTIYNALIMELDTAINLIKTADPIATIPGDDDCVFNGEMTSWVQFANSIKLRIFTRESDVMDVSAGVAAIIAEGSGFITDDVLVNPGYLVEEGKQNPMWDQLGWDVSGTQTLSSKATCATDYIVGYLGGTYDPRIDFIYERPETGHLGVMQGLLDYDTPVVDAYIPELVSNIGPGILQSATMGACIFTLAENYFNQAELVQKGDMTGDAGVLYAAGVQASFDYLGAGDASTYLGQGINLTGWAASAGSELEAIITQKWIATNGITAEQSWFDYSRTGFPSNLPVSDLASTPDRPVRLFYIADEISSNGDNVPAQPHAFNDKIFWAK